MINITKIAEIAGVSRSTVSRVLNNHPHVNETTREHVMKIMKEFDYIPNINAVQLKVGRTKIIGVMTPTINNYYMQYINGIALEGKKEGYQVLIYQTDEQADQEQAALELLRQKKVDGLIVLRRLMSWKTIEKYTEYGPIVTCEPLNSGKIPSVYMDHYEGFRLGIEHLVERGYHHIACTIGRKHSTNSKRRIQAYMDVLEKYGLPHKEEWMLYGVRTVEDGIAAFKKLERLADKPHAIVTTNDFVASGILSSARSSGFRVPEDIAVVGFEADESQVADAMQLTNITNPLKNIGQDMFRIFMNKLQCKPFEYRNLEFQLIVREST
ncbi:MULTISPECIES: LacI family DNA-binding transcriptional regulator [Paenibacillus]|uniref:LacI family DNA-binding transcriptional regulator n=1 Tax=Paenibacillus TaxID=44249 RepID=UPI001F2E455B|nr:LacI family DNA-binding transcriptional regulator [Paenibacillus sp. JJ-223]CAH1198873.1 HTH-type transcriptional regulator DegA [Paenibacillus sp. JJ-223]